MEPNVIEQTVYPEDSTPNPKLWIEQITKVWNKFNCLGLVAILLGSLAREEITEGSDLEMILFDEGTTTNNLTSTSANESISGNSQAALHSVSTTSRSTNSEAKNIVDDLKKLPGYWTTVDNKLATLSAQAYSFDFMIQEYQKMFIVKEQNNNTDPSDCSAILSRIGGLLDCYSLSNSISTEDFVKRVLHKIGGVENCFLLLIQDYTDYTDSGDIENSSKIKDYAQKLAEKDGKEMNEVCFVN